MLYLAFMPKKEVARARAKRGSKKEDSNPVSAFSPMIVNTISPPAEEVEDAEYDAGVFDGLAATKDDD